MESVARQWDICFCMRAFALQRLPPVARAPCFFLARLELKAADGRDKPAKPHNDS
jgi:hypothetical protein